MRKKNNRTISSKEITAPAIRLSSSLILKSSSEEESNERAASEQSQKERESFLIAAVGGGPGSLNAFPQMLARLPSHPGIAFLFTCTEEDTGSDNLPGFLENA